MSDGSNAAFARSSCSNLLAVEVFKNCAYKNTATASATDATKTTIAINIKRSERPGPRITRGATDTCASCGMKEDFMPVSMAFLSVLEFSQGKSNRNRKSWADLAENLDQ